MRELIHPVTGVRREWAESQGGAIHAREALQAVPAAGRMKEFPPQTAARMEAHQLGFLMTPVRPDYARNILWTARNGDIYRQWELFCFMEEWDRLSKNLNEVKNAVRRLNWNVAPHTERGEKPTESAKEKADLVSAALKNWQPEVGTLEYSFEDFIYNAMDALGKGISVQEIHWYQRNGAWMPRAAHLLTPRQYAWGPDGTRLGLTDPQGNNSASGVNYFQGWRPFPEMQFVVGMWQTRSGVPGATALLRSLVPYWMGVVYGWKWLMQTAQIFGVPLRWATYDDSPGLASKVADMLENMGSAGWAAFPTGTTLEIKEAVTNARDNPQALILDLAKKACDLLILGQELSSESTATGLGSGTALLQGKVRQDVLHHAAAWMGDLMSYQLVRPLMLLNYGNTDESPEIRPDLAVDPDPLQMAQRDQILINSGMIIPARYMYDRHQIPEPEDGEPVVVAPGVAQGPQPKSGEQGAQSPEEEMAEGGTDTKAEEDAEGKVAARFGGSLTPPIQASATDKLIENVLEDLTGIEARWLGGVKPFFRELIVMAKDESITDDQFVAKLKKAQKSFPELFDKLDMDSLAKALEASMGAAVVNGAVQGFLDRRAGGRNKQRRAA